MIKNGMYIFLFNCLTNIGLPNGLLTSRHKQTRYKPKYKMSKNIHGNLLLAVPGELRNALTTGYDFYSYDAIEFAIVTFER